MNDALRVRVIEGTGEVVQQQCDFWEAGAWARVVGMGGEVGQNGPVWTRLILIFTKM